MRKAKYITVTAELIKSLGFKEVDKMNINQFNAMLEDLFFCNNEKDIKDTILEHIKMM
jgi:hypothetical protein